MATDSRREVAQSATTATTADRQQLDTFNAVASTTDERSSSAAEPGGDSDTADRTDVLNGERGTGDGGDDRAGTVSSGLSAAGTPVRGSDDDLLQFQPTAGVADSGEPQITVGAGSDSRADANVLVPADESSGTPENGTDSATTETRSGIRLELDDTQSGDSRAGDASGEPDSPVEARSGIRIELNDTDDGGSGLGQAGASAPAAQSIDVFDSVNAKPSPIQHVDGPSNIPGEDSLITDRARGESGPGTLSPEITSADVLDDQFGLNLTQDSSPKGFFGDRSLELPDIPTAGGLPEPGSTVPIDVGVDFAHLGGSSSLDGRTHDAYDGVPSGNSAVGPADPTDMLSSGGGSTGSPYTTNADSDMSKAEKAVDAVIKGIQDGTKPNDYITIQLGLEGSLVDVPAPEPAATPPVEPVAEKSNAEIKNDQKKFIGEDVPTDGHGKGDGVFEQAGTKSWLESLTSLLQDQSEGDLISPSEGGLGSAPTAAIGQSILIGLGGQRGGDVDPHDETEPATSGEVIYDPVDSVINPSKDHVFSSFEADRSMLGGPMDHVAPELDDTGE